MSKSTTSESKATTTFLNGFKTKTMSILAGTTTTFLEQQVASGPIPLKCNNMAGKDASKNTKNTSSRTNNSWPNCQS